MGGYNKNITRDIFHVFFDNITNVIGEDMVVRSREVKGGEVYIPIQLRRANVYAWGVNRDDLSCTPEDLRSEERRE